MIAMRMAAVSFRTRTPNPENDEAHHPEEGTVGAGWNVGNVGYSGRRTPSLVERQQVVERFAILIPISVMTDVPSRENSFRDNGRHVQGSPPRHLAETSTWQDGRMTDPTPWTVSIRSKVTALTTLGLTKMSELRTRATPLVHSAIARAKRLLGRTATS
jgi:hypothetical protein